jgi:hypothetical protein
MVSRITDPPFTGPNRGTPGDALVLYIVTSPSVADQCRTLLSSSSPRQSSLERQRREDNSERAARPDDEVAEVALTRAPLGPRNPKISRAPTVKDTPRTAGRGAPGYVKPKEWTSITATSQ